MAADYFPGDNNNGGLSGWKKVIAGSFGAFFAVSLPLWNRWVVFSAENGSAEAVDLITSDYQVVFWIVLAFGAVFFVWCERQNHALGCFFEAFGFTAVVEALVAAGQLPN